MSIDNRLKEHMEKVETAKKELEKAHQTWTAYNDAFMAWLSAELKIENKKDVHLSEILAKWNEKTSAPN